MRLFATPLLLCALLSGTLLAVPAAALAQYDPAASRAENQVNSLSRSISRQQQDRAVQQQNQFETNALRNEMTRPAPPPLVPNAGMAPLRR